MKHMMEGTNQAKKLIDLHIHSTNSDSEQTPEEVIRCAREAGLSAIAITDHNVFTYTQPFVDNGIQVISGIEFSVEYYVPSGDSVCIRGPGKKKEPEKW